MDETGRLLLVETLPGASGEDRYRLLTYVLDEMPQMVWAADKGGSHFFYNKQWYAYTGLTPEQSMGFGFANALHPDDVERTLARWRRAWEAGEDYEIEYRFVRRDGAARWFVGRAQAVRGADGQVAMWVGTCTNIHEQKENEARLEAALRREEVRNRIAEALRTATGPESVMDTACRQVARALGCPRALYVEVDTARGTAAAREFSPGGSFGKNTFPLRVLDETLLEELEAGRTIVVPDTRADPRTAASYGSVYAPNDIRAYVAVPVERRGEWASLLVAIASGAPRHWTDEDVALLEAVAGQTEAVAELARLHARERRTAQAFQDTVSPPAPERLGAYRFASHYAAALDESAIGGDFYDQFALPGGRVGVVVGDVSGKGLAAAVQTALVKFTLRGFAAENPAPGDTLSRLNRALLAQGALSGFVTLCFVVLDPAAGRLVYASAGHEPPILCPAAGGPRELMPTGPVVGVADAHDYDECVLPFAVGDRLLLYTDGLSEARGETSLLGTERIARMFCRARAGETPKAAVARLLREAARFAARGFRDDLALLVVQAAEPATGGASPAVPARNTGP